MTDVRHRRAAQARLHPHLRVPDERLRFGPHGRCPAAAGLCPRRHARAGRSGRAEHLPYPRACLGEGLFRARPPARHQARAPRRGPRPHHRRRRLRRPGRGQGDHCAASLPSTSSSARRPIIGCPSCWPRPSASRRPPRRQAPAGRGVLDTDFPAESKFDHLPAPQGVRAGSAFLSIQEGCDKFCTFCVVPYTRGAEYSRPAAGRAGRSTPARGGGCDRDHAARPERQRLSRRGGGRFDLVARPPDPRAGRDRGHRAHPLHDLAIRATWMTS